MYYRLHPGPTYACHTCEWTVNNNGTRLVHHYLAYTVHSKTSVGKNFCSFSLNCECCPANHGLFDWQYKSTTMNSEILWCIDISHAKLESFPRRCFPIYGMYVLMYICMYVSVHVRTCHSGHFNWILSFLGPTDPWNIKM